jgi:cation transport regulator ChaB
MPYSNKKDLPDAVKKLPEHRQHIWMDAWNAAYEHYGSEKSAFKVAWAASKRGKKVEDKKS